VDAADLAQQWVDAVGHQQPGVAAGHGHAVAELGRELLAEQRDRALHDRQALGRRHAQPALEAARDASRRELLRDHRSASVDEHGRRTRPRQRADVSDHGAARGVSVMALPPYLMTSVALAPPCRVPSSALCITEEATACVC
jgi:hypothetical protein